jgi:iron complex outermembrane receptor protein
MNTPNQESPLPSTPHLPAAVLLGGLFALIPTAGAQAPLERIVITADRESEPLTVVTDPRKPRQPLPAHDGADYLKTIPGFSVIRKGGTDGDPVLRGMAGSRLNVLIEGEHILGGCGARMDPPTAYVFPEAFDRIVVIKGPQSVLHGAGATAGSVLFERQLARLAAPGAGLYASALAGSFGRNDQVLDVLGGTPDHQLRATATRSHSGDYEDGGGQRVHSRYTRWSTQAAYAWTPDDRTVLEVTGARSDGEAAYADRGMDGVAFDRTNLGVKFRRDGISPLVERLEAKAFWNYVDHVMDNYSLRSFRPTPMSATPAVSNPDRETLGARLVATLAPRDADRLKLGLDAQRNEHTLRVSMNQPVLPYESLPRLPDAQFDNRGVFGEWTRFLDLQRRLVAGLRIDHWQARDLRADLALGRGAMSTVVPNPTAHSTRSDTLASGFVRIERDASGGRLTMYAGVGSVARFPDYWELFSDREAADSVSAFGIRPERNTQLDAGLLYRADGWNATLAAFAGRVDDYVLIQSGVPRTAPTRTAIIARNIDATTVGLEASLGRTFAQHWKADATLAWVRGHNETDGRPLAQQPPLEARLSVTREVERWMAGALLRLVAGQDRVDPGSGNIAGQDIGPTGGFAVFALNAAYRWSDALTLSAGVDNLFDRRYAEHLSRAGAMVPGYLQTSRVNEPGRTLWVRAEGRF